MTEISCYFKSVIALYLFTFRYNKREKKMEKDVITQAITIPAPPRTASEPLPPAKSLLLSQREVPPEDQHTFTLPENTAGQANVRGTVKRNLFPPVPCDFSSTSVPTQSQPVIFRFVNSQGEQLILPAPSESQSASMISSQQFAKQVPRTTAWNRKRKGDQPTRAYTRSNQYRKCSDCGERQDSSTGHRQYYGKFFCPKTATKSVDEWLAEQKAQSWRNKNK
jgi:hypothetical protein